MHVRNESNQVPDWLERMLIERQELADRTSKLAHYLRTKCTPETIRSGRHTVKHFNIMHKQLRVMRRYLEILDVRISESGWNERIARIKADADD